MTRGRGIRALRAAVATALVAGGLLSHAQQPVVLDSVVAVVNNRAILSSDLTEAMRLSILEPRESREDIPTPQTALQRLISRTLIQQQIRQEDARAAEPSDKEVATRIEELRKELPACVRMKCATDDGWAAFLQANGLTESEVKDYIRMRLEMLAFIEDRFRHGIRISQEEIESYYRNSLLPQYAKGEAVPKLKDVAPRIEEVLLQQQVNALFGSWLENLRKQGDVEIIDPSLEPPAVRKNGAPAHE